MTLPMHPRTGKRDRRGYNGNVQLDGDLHRQLARWCHLRGVSMRATVGAAINAKLDEIEQKGGKP